MATAEPTARRRAVQAAVLAATEDLLREGASYADLSIEAIARRAGISGAPPSTSTSATSASCSCG